ncbi:unnamed protein product, partial [Mesorhabditis spiculigera]
MPRCHNGLCLLRIVFISLLSLLLHRLYTSYSEAYHRIQNKPNITRLNWTDVDIEHPPRLTSESAARAVFNELLASTPIKCPHVKPPASSKGLVYHQCDRGVKGGEKRCLLISGTDRLDGLIPLLNCTKWTICVPLGHAAIDMIDGDVEVNYLMEVEWWKEWDVDGMDGLHREPFDAILLNLELHAATARHFNASTIPQTLGRIMKLAKAETILVSVQLPKNGLESVNDYRQWILTSFYRDSYGLIGASTNGFCMEPSKFCTFGLSFERFEKCSDALAPAFGLGSPTEEKMRFMLSLHKPQPDCPLSSTVAQKFTFCSTLQPSYYDIVYIGTKNLTLSDFPEVVKPTSTIRNLRSPSELNPATVTDLLLIDLNTVVWGELRENLNKMMGSKQVALAMSLYVEEGENYRLFYSITRCLRKALRLAYGNWHLDAPYLRLHAILRRNGL